MVASHMDAWIETSKGMSGLVVAFHRNAWIEMLVRISMYYSGCIP